MPAVEVGGIKHHRFEGSNIFQATPICLISPLLLAPSAIWLCRPPRCQYSPNKLGPRTFKINDKVQLSIFREGRFLFLNVRPYCILSCCGHLVLSNTVVLWLVNGCEVLYNGVFFWLWFIDVNLLQSCSLHNRSCWLPRDMVVERILYFIILVVRPCSDLEQTDSCVVRRTAR